MSADFIVLEKLLPLAIRRDQYRLRRALDKLRADAKAGRDVAAELAGLRGRIEASLAIRAARAASVPGLDYPDLPVAEKRDDILAAVLQHQVVIVCGETGSGKTTQLPKICLEAGRGVTASSAIPSRGALPRVASPPALPRN